MDGTCKICNFGLVLICVGLVVRRWVRKRWRMSCLPLVFSIARSENTSAYRRTLEALILHLNTHCGFTTDNFISRISYAFVDGAGGSAKAIRDLMPHCEIFRCLQHVKKNVGRLAPIFMGKKMGHAIRRHVELTAFISSPAIFTRYWTKVLSLWKAACPNLRARIQTIN